MVKAVKNQKHGFPFGKPSGKGIKVKICGITNLADAKVAIAAGADALGFIFYPKSKRFIKPSDAKKIISRLPKSIKKVGVFVNEKKLRVRTIANVCQLDILQFHGNESVGYCNHFKQKRIIKAFRIKDTKSLKSISGYVVDAFLLDSYHRSHFGGTGKTFQWEVVKKIKKLNTPIVLSGGLNPANIQGAIRKTEPYAVDVSTGVERIPGKKDHRLLRKFVKAAKTTRTA
ncbi:phosphoribosylanthranilate isomerase [Candidatus Omnitrophota bacterium]